MKKTILLTGATDGIGLVTAKMLVADGHHVLLHGRNPTKLEAVHQELSSSSNPGSVEAYVADLSKLSDVEALASSLLEKHNKLDILINNAGVLKTSNPIAENGMDVRFVVNTIAPYLLTQRLLPIMDVTGRIINLSSAAQSSVDLRGLKGEIKLGDMDAYSQSKLAITMWSKVMAESLEDGPVVIAVNPGSLLGSKMVREGFGVAGGDLRVGATILCRLSLEEEFVHSSGLYFDNDAGRFGAPHPDALNSAKSAEVVEMIESILAAEQS